MKESSESLEFTLIIDELASYALSPEGADSIRTEKPCHDPELLTEELACTGMTARLLSISEPRGLGSFPDIGELIDRVRKSGMFLDGQELFDIGTYLYQSLRLSDWITNPPEGYIHRMPNVEASLPPEITELSRTILGQLEAPGVVRKDHPRIKPLYRELERFKRERTVLSSSLIHDEPSLWQQDTPTIRDGRIVLPVKSSSRGKVPGFVHGVSATGNTLFVEPQVLVESNNQVIIQEQKIQAEYIAVLKEISSKVRSCIPEIEIARTVTGRCDHLYAKARFTVIHNCEVPHVASTEILLRQARHPLLGRNAIPIDVDIPRGKRAVIMTGPNAGGKTVSVKTIGLFSLMVQYGIPVPASSESRIPIFSSVHADIGDDQSIAESLSTFSGHMKKIAAILAGIDKDSLVILDELASGTDTYEGSALAKSILEHCLDTGCLTLVTSHHMSLKQFAYTDERVLNASMEFDDTRKVPTYRILFGAPGNSYAIETAQRMGLPPGIIETARKYLVDESDRASWMIHRLEQQELELHQKQLQFREREKQLMEEKRSFDLKFLQLKQQELMFRKKDFSFVGRFIDQSRSELENLVRSLREGELTREKLRKVKDFQEQLEEKQRSAGEILKQQERQVSEKRGYRFSPGMRVYAGTGRTAGVIARKGKKPGFWHVEMGSLRIDIHENELIPIEYDTDKFYDATDTVEIRYDRQSSVPRFEMDVRGEILDSALRELEQQLDRALLHGVSRFSIIHGKGEGILQRGIHDFLSQHPSVKNFFFAPPEQGGFGKTIVEIDS